MFLDDATLQDLDILPVLHRRGATLWSLIDRTRTSAGAKALRRRLLEPPTTADEIVALQQAHRVLAADESYRAILDGAELDSVERYLALNWQLPADMPGLARFRKWHRHYVKDVAQGRAHVAALLEAAAKLQRRLAAAGTPALDRLGDELTTLLDAPDVRRLRELADRGSPGALRAFDQAARGRGKGTLTAVIQHLATVEAMWSLGAATHEHGWAFPVPSTRLRISGLVHPFLGRQAVPNDLQLHDGVRVCFVTGPNMAGKSTFLKGVATAVVLAHAGCGVPAASMEFPVVSAVFSSINVEENLGAKESFYLAEVRRVGALARLLDEQGTTVAVIDEPFRGTNVHDAAEATLAVVMRLARQPASLFFVASHVGEIVPEIADNPAVALLRFAADVSDDRPQFDYRLRHGVSMQRMGMLLLREEGVLELLDRSAGVHERSAARASDSTVRP